ncbi:MAG: methyl-accepting chemotaxis protein [Oleiphilaceae bacterium]|nr:methyl-accepting chemotaxis protein [Oleiphilaceae bacterium]
MFAALKDEFSSPLLKPIHLALVIGIIAQAVLILGISSENIGSMQRAINTQLVSSQENISQRLERANTSLTATVDETSQKVAAEVGKALEERLDMQQQSIAATLEDYVLQSAQSSGAILADIAAPYYWDNDVPQLTRLAELAHGSAHVLFAVFKDDQGRPLTRYLNRKHPRVKALLQNSDVRGSVNKVLDAATRDDGIILLDRPVMSNDVVLGTFTLGISKSAIVEELRELGAQYQALIGDARDAVKRGMEQESALMTASLKQSNRQVQLNTFQSLTDANLAISRASSALNSALALAVVASGLVLMGVVMWLLSRAVLRRVKVLKSAIWDVADGEGDLTQRIDIEGSDEIAEMAEGLNRFINNTHTLVAEVKQSSSTASEMTQSMTGLFEEARGATHSQKQELDQVSSAMTEMSATVQEVAQSIENMRQQVETIRGDANQTTQVSATVRKQLEHLESTIESASSVINALDGYSAEIGSVVDVIQSIAEQTNLLALNAAIEAARAGESGRGFAVVADEVRALAGKTQQSTEEIVSKIDSLQAGSQKAVQAITQSRDIAAESRAAFGQTDGYMESVSLAVNNLSEMTGVVANMAREQKHVADEIEQNIVRVYEEAQESSSVVEQAEQAGQTMQQLVSDLSTQVSRFHV